MSGNRCVSSPFVCGDGISGAGSGQVSTRRSRVGGAADGSQEPRHMLARHTARSQGVARPTPHVTSPSQTGKQSRNTYNFRPG